MFSKNLMDENFFKYKKACLILQDTFPDLFKDIKEERMQPRTITLKDKYLKTRRHKRIEELKKIIETNNISRDATFYENLVCKNESCLFLNSDKTEKLGSKNLVDERIFELELSQKFTLFPPSKVAEGLTSYMLYILKNISPIDLVGDNNDLRDLIIFLDDLSKFIVYDIKQYGYERVSYYFLIAEELKKLNNLSGVECVINGIKNCSLDDENYLKLIDFEKNFDKNELFLEAESSIPSLGLLLEKLSNQQNSKEFIAIIDFFSNLEEKIIDEEMEYNIFRTIQDYNFILEKNDDNFSLEYLEFITGEF